jgi:carboxy-cis,cis-muconate cyclase
MGWIGIFSLLLANRALAYKHHLFTSSISTPHLYSLEYDDETNTIINIANITSNAGHPWLSFSFDKANLYAEEVGAFTSYTVENDSSLISPKNVKVGTQCGQAGAGGNGAGVVIAEQRRPFSVIGAPTGSCGTVVGVQTDGRLEKIAQTFKYGDRSSIKGFALDPDNTFLYSADSGMNGIWTHSVTEQGITANPVFTQLPWANSGPGKLVMHPNGKYLYVALSRRNAVAVVAINSGAGAARTPLVSTGVSYSLLPEG